MTKERRIRIDGTDHRLLISDEPQALLAAKAAGRAVLGVENAVQGDWSLRGIPYVVPGWEYDTEELEELILRRHLGLPWMIDLTERLMIREFVKGMLSRSLRRNTPGKRRFSGRKRLWSSISAVSMLFMNTVPGRLCAGKQMSLWGWQEYHRRGRKYLSSML